MKGKKRCVDSIPFKLCDLLIVQYCTNFIKKKNYFALNFIKLASRSILIYYDYCIVGSNLNCIYLKLKKKLSKKLRKKINVAESYQIGKLRCFHLLTIEVEGLKWNFANHLRE